VLALAQTGNGQERAPDQAADRESQLIGKLKDADWHVREDATAELGNTDDPRWVETLIAALKDANSHVQRGAATALGRIGDRRAVEPLIEALWSMDQDVRSAAAEALGLIGDPRAVGPLTSALGASWRAGSLTVVARGALEEIREAEQFRTRTPPDRTVSEESVHYLPSVAELGVNSCWNLIQNQYTGRFKITPPGFLPQRVDYLQRLLREFRIQAPIRICYSDEAFRSGRYIDVSGRGPVVAIRGEKVDISIFGGNVLLVHGSWKSKLPGVKTPLFRGPEVDVFYRPEGDYLPAGVDVHELVTTMWKRHASAAWLLAHGAERPQGH
jgi:hypothetical protein